MKVALKVPLKIAVTLFITVMGFLLGMVLAGVGGLSAKTMSFYQRPDSEENKKIERYWSETGLGFAEVTELLSNEKCYSSSRYYEACLNAIAEGALSFDKQLSPVDGELTALTPGLYLDEKSEKELLQWYTGLDNEVNFDRALQKIISYETRAEKKSALAARLINSFLSVYSDPHTYILPGNFYSEVGSKIDRSKFFIGVSYEKIGGRLFVRRVVANSDADRAGLKTGDRILAINSVSVTDMRYRDVAGILRDEDTALFRLRVVRAGQPLELEIRRSYRRLSHVQYNGVQDGRRYGVISLSKFNSGACAEIAEAILRAREEKVAGLVLDLRDNPGGQLDEAACIAGLFLGRDKKAYYVEYFDENKANEVALTSEEQLYKGPVTVLVNSGSASSSELLAGGLQDYGRALIIGERTFGKGTFQESEDWELNPKVSLFRTQGLYLLPSRNSTQMNGVQPDVQVNEPPGFARDKREEDIYFNPLPHQAPFYSGLRESEKVHNYLFTGCGPVRAAEAGEDAFLSAGLHYLKCARAVDHNLAQNHQAFVN